MRFNINGELNKSTILDRIRRIKLIPDSAACNKLVITQWKLTYRQLIHYTTIAITITNDTFLPKEQAAEDVNTTHYSWDKMKALEVHKS